MPLGHLANRDGKMHVAQDTDFWRFCSSWLKICVGKPLKEVGLRSMICSYVAHVQSLSVKILSWAPDYLI